MSRLLIVSNRLPETVAVAADGSFSTFRSAGGLATGLAGLRGGSEVHWVGWPGDTSRLDEARLAELDRVLAERHTSPVHLTPAEISGYYDGFSNGVLWPLFHYLSGLVRLDAWRDWETYQEVNARFADVVAAAYRPGDLVWVHDYQLALLPRLLRERLPDARIGYFLHIPFPSSEMFRILPWRAQILEGLLGADLIGFHAFPYLRHFGSSILRVLGLETEVDRVRLEHRTVRLGVFPMSIDSASFDALGADPEVQAAARAIRREHGEPRLLVGIDRLDHTKGLPGRILAYERLLEREPRLRGRVKLLQLVVPSRIKVGAYDELRQELDRLVGHVSGRFATVEWNPIQYLFNALSPRDLTALYLACDVMVVTPLRDGMNLVAKEFIAARSDGDGVLVLSEFAGAASELGEALHCNPYDLDGLAQIFRAALDMPPEERRARMGALRKHVLGHTVQTWTQTFLDALAEAPPQQPPARGAHHHGVEELGRGLAAAEELLLFLDYDGTLVGFAATPELAEPDPELRRLLWALARRKHTTVHVVSGRPLEVLEAWFGELPIGLHAEHGFWSRFSTEEGWRPAVHLDTSWKEMTRPILAEFCAHTPRSFIEEKRTSLAWHYRMADPEFGAIQAKELRLHLAEVMAHAPVEIVKGNKVIELRQRGVHKGLVIAPCRERAPRGAVPVAFGDDWTDEQLFAAIPEGGITVCVGARPSRATHRVSGPPAVRALLSRLITSS